MSGEDSNPFGDGADVDVDAAKWLLKALKLVTEGLTDLERAGAMQYLVDAIDDRLEAALDKLMGKPTPNDAEA